MNVEGPSTKTIPDTLSAAKETLRLKRTPKMTKVWYALFAIISAAIIVIGSYVGQVGDVVIAVPTLVITVMMLFYDKDFIHVPPMLIFIVIVTMVISLIASMVPNSIALTHLCSFLGGVVLSLVGLITAYISLGKRPGAVNEKSGIIAIEALTFGLATFMIWMMVVHYVNYVNVDLIKKDIYALMDDAIWVALGCVFIAILYLLDSKNRLMTSTVDRFLTNNSTLMGISIDEAQETKDIIDKGESATLEFKSTLMTNLQTGEPDKRMEKAVLKTVTAFLNTDGGTLLVGVEDNGNIRGIDIERFESRDKMNLHITNIIAAQIGNEFIPFIKFEQVDYGMRDDGKERIVMRFDCTPTSTPAFLKNTKEKTETFFVRSGPSSVELTGNDLINYVINRKKTSKKLRPAMTRE